MATTPRTIEASNQAAPPKTPEQAMGAAKERAENVKPVIDEQRTRSSEIEAMGVDAWRIAHDERPESERSHLAKGQITAGGGIVEMRAEEHKRVPGTSVRQPEDKKL